MPLVEETVLLAPEGMVTLTALKWTGASPTVGNLAEATTVRAVGGAAGGVCPAAVAASAAAQTRNVAIGVARMWLSVNKFIRITQDLIGGQILDEHRGLVYASPLRPKTSAADGTHLYGSASRLGSCLPLRSPRALRVSAASPSPAWRSSSR